MQEVITQNIPVEFPEFLEEYLKFVDEKVTKPLREVLNNWLENPEPFKTHYAKWVSKKEIEVKQDEEYKEEYQSDLFEDHG